MFGKLKDKLKKSLSLFSKKTEEVAEESEELKELIKEESQEEPVLEAEEKSTSDKSEKVNEPEQNFIEQELDVAHESEKEEAPIQREIEELQAEEKRTEKKSGSEVKEEVKKQEISVGEKKVDSSEPKIEIIKPSSQEIIDEVKEKISKEENIVTEKDIEETTKEVKEISPEKKGFFSKFKQALTTKTISSEKFEDLFWDLELVLLESNVSVKVIERIKEDLKHELVNQPLPRDIPTKIKEVLSNTLKEILSIERFSLLDRIEQKKSEGKPYVIMFFGINGAGKTTSIAKLAHLLKEKGNSIVFAASDTFRAAAIQQLEDHANKLGIKMIKHDYGSDAAAVAYDAVKHAEKHKINVVMIDTAGRLHSNTNLMAELDKICRVTNPDLKVFVGESITGNDCVEQAEKFNELVNLDAAILSKADIDEDGGAPLSIAYTIKKPILYLGMGQRYGDLEEFSPELILRRLGFED
ncbi:signal recognition particle-docking protein FtsY [archaeon]|nr:signal recognition particle-docking protein FtsY [archaeon]